MAPARGRLQHNDQKSETSSIQERTGSITGTTINGRGRRTADTAGPSRDATSAAQSSSGGPSSELAPSIQWSTFENSTLEAYRHSYRLNTQPAFSNPYNQLILSQPGVGRLSPTMARRKDQRKQSKEQLANTVRKHFNSMGIVENVVVVDFLYKVRWQDKAFRMHLTPPRPSIKEESFACT